MIFMSSGCFFVSDLKQELQVKEKERCPDNERLMNGYSTPPKVDSNRLRIENETQTSQSPFIRKIHQTCQTISSCCKKRKQH